MAEKSSRTPLSKSHFTPSETCCDLIVGVLALWTLLSHGAVAVGANLYQLLTVAGVCILAWCVYWLGGWRSRREAANANEVPVLVPPTDLSGQNPSWRRLGEISLVLGGYGLYLWTRSWTIFWWTSTGLLLLFLACSWRHSAIDEPPLERRGWRWVLWGLAVFCALATLFVHRPDLDDALYVGHAVGIADHPTKPILAQDILHGIDGLPLPSPVYKVEALGIAIAAIAAATPLAALDVAHLLIPLCAALLLPFVYARLFRQLMPRHWLWGVIIALAFLWCAGDTHRSVGNFAFVRLFQGKAIFLTVGTPLILSAALAYGREPSRKHWWRLAATQVAAVGLTSTALFIAPILAGLGLLTSMPWRKGSIRLLAIGVAASTYVLGLSLWMFTEMSTQGAALASASRAPLRAPNPTPPFIRGADWVLGSGWQASFAVLAILGAAVASRSVLGRRFALVFPLGFLLVLWNPFLDGWLQAHFLDRHTYWRIFWVLPLPVLVALLLTAPRYVPAIARKGLATSLAATLLLVAPSLFSNSTKTWSEANGVRWGWPEWKVPQADFEAAIAIAAHAPPDSMVLAPPEVSPWIVTLHDHPNPLIVRRAYLRSLRRGLGAQEAKRRLGLVRWTKKRRRARDADITAAIDDFDLRAICTRIEVSEDPSVQNLLSSKGFEQVETTAEYVIWAR